MIHRRRHSSSAENELIAGERVLHHLSTLIGGTQPIELTLPSTPKEEVLPDWFLRGESFALGIVFDERGSGIAELSDLLTLSAALKLESRECPLVIGAPQGGESFSRRYGFSGFGPRSRSGQLLTQGDLPHDAESLCRYLRESGSALRIRMTLAVRLPSLAPPLRFPHTTSTVILRARGGISRCAEARFINGDVLEVKAMIADSSEEGRESVEQLAELPVEIALGEIELSALELLHLRVGSRIQFDPPSVISATISVGGAPWALAECTVTPENFSLSITKLLWRGNFRTESSIKKRESSEESGGLQQVP